MHPQDVDKSTENDLIKARYDHLKTLREQGVEPFASRVERTHTTKDAKELWQNNASTWSSTPGQPTKDAPSITITGRLIALRSHGGATFADIEDGYGKLQVLAQESVLKNRYQWWWLFDLGDFIQATGRLFITKRGEITLHVEQCEFLSKSLRPLPDKWHGLEDKEKRYRERYADLISNEVVRQKFRLRSRIVATMRQELELHDFMEVDTPVLQHLAGGATAKPFVTHYNAYDIDVFLRVAPELYHKRLIVGGFERVYEFARVFRNEGVDHAHNPEFTDLEFYAAYWDYEKMMDFSEALLRKVVYAVHGSLKFTYKNFEIDFESPFRRISFQKAIQDITNIDIFTEDAKTLREKMKQLKIEMPPIVDFGKLCDLLYKAKVRPTFIQPTFLIDHPLELSPLAKKKNERETERFQIIAAGEFELCNAFTELNDPIDQKERFMAQEKLRQTGDDEAQSYDADFIRALEYGMPPTAGFGMGVDRLVALLTDSHTLREIILFPFMKPREE